MVHLRQRLAKFIRDKRGDTPQREFARKIGLAQSTIMRIENLDQNVTLETLEQLCKVFHADVSDLFPLPGTPKIYPPISPSGGHDGATAIHEKLPNDSRRRK
ncbi:MAG: hypothetical protein A3H44_15455 [Gammaproteobacteria bacterium RIFCSPLOWO2_02_FULL_57_10]|nr:MAG: hypothetical protein A3H44_15455 [Gammaproteobacteria bacterium RIFCSPLOWO2_02_FULL_57_10]